MKKTKSIRQKVSELRTSESLTLPLTELPESTARNYASRMGVAQEKTFSVSLNRTERTITILRVW